MARAQQTYRCSFCGKSQETVARLIAGPGGVYICDECIALCEEIIADERRGAAPPPTRDESSSQVMAFVPGFGERVFDALLALGYHIDIADDGAITAWCESTVVPTAPPRVEGQVGQDGQIIWLESVTAQRALFAARIVALRSRI